MFEEALKNQIDAHKTRDHDRSVLATALGVFHSDGHDSLQALEKLQAERQQAIQAHDTDRVVELGTAIHERINKDAEALQSRGQVDGLITGGLKTAALFLPGGSKVAWLARAATVGIYGLDQAHSGDSLGQQGLDFAIGGGKGMALRGILSASNGLNNPFMQGVVVGGSSRLMDAVTNKDGSIAAALDLRALATDGLTFTAAHGLGLGVKALSGADLASKPFFNTVTTSAAFGFTTGTHREFERQRVSGEDFDLTKALKWGLLNAAVDGVAGIPGGYMASRLAATSAPSTERLDSRRGTPELARLKDQAGRLIEPKEGEPLNVYSKGPEAIGRFWSNFTRAPFSLDGTRFASIEGFYVSLKTADPALKEHAANLSGAEAKNFGRRLPKTEHGFYEGKVFKMGSAEHHSLIARALRAKADAHPDMAQALADTFPRPIVHDLGHPENPRTAYPASAFTRALENLRSDIIGERSSGGAVPVSTEGKSITDALRGIRDPDIHSDHDVELYAKAVENTGVRVKDVVTAGSDSIVFETTAGNIFKVGNKRLFDEMGTRPFDMPILRRGTFDDGRQYVQWYEQPKAEMNVTAPEAVSFYEAVESQGFQFRDPGTRNVGRYQGKLVLIDPWAVSRKGRY